MKQETPSIARTVMAIASLIGFFSSAYLFYTYVTGADIACAIVSGCDIVRASKWASTFGVPRPFLGLVFYAGVLALLVIRAATAKHGRLTLQLTRGAAAIGFIESGFLFAIQWLDLKAFCLWCLISAASATTIMVAAFFDRASQPSEKELRRLFIALFFFFSLGALGFWRLLAA